MDLNSDKIIAEEFDYVLKNEPTFRINGNQLVGKVGRTADGDDILINISFPEFYPIIKPEVFVLNGLKHPNINPNRALDLQILDEWEPFYRIKDVISATRRLFIHSKARIVKIASDRSTPSMAPSNLEIEIGKIQSEISDMNSKINELKSKKLATAGVKSAVTGSMPISKELDAECTALALADLLELLEIKFEEADVDQTDFFRLYRKYIRDYYLTIHETNQMEVKLGDKITQTKRPVTS
ncbi:MAG: hypothetical protein IH840_17435 [Candidatus Heimdallarchaeota archaeon]|nr:hypothetical protein [Candidatus Heimdallarchaeota archaeon]